MEVQSKEQIKNPVSPTTVAWISDFPLEWLPDLPMPLRALPRQHPGTWQMVLLAEFEKNPALRLHVIILRKQIEQDFSFERNGTVFHILKVPGGMRAPSLFWIDTILIRRLIKKIKPDLVHAWGTEKGAALIASRAGFPYVVTIQGLLTWYQQVVPVSRYERFAAAVETLSLKRAKIATTESVFAVDYLKEKYPRLQVHQAEHAPNWLFHRIERRPQTKPIRFISIATIDYRKGSDLLLHALNALTGDFSFELVIVSGPNRAYIDALRESLTPELWSRITFKTHLLPSDVAVELSMATMLLLPTRADTSPNAVKEAVVAGVPVVASAIGGIVDYVFPGKNGVLFPSDDLNAFIEAIRAACLHPLFSRGEVDPDTLKKTRDYLSPPTMSARFLEAYAKALR